jgi:8-hydroxy-5-deazaflavin:NADPH oxidoreductase
MAEKLSIAVLGATGDLGGGLAWQLVQAGYPVIIGSRAQEKAESSAAALSQRAGGKAVRGMVNPEAAAAADLVILTVPFASHKPTLESISDAVQGKIFVDATVPLMPPKVMRVQMPKAGSAAREAQDYLGEEVRVVSAFQNVAADHLNADDAHLDDCDVLVSGNDPEARETVVQLAQELGMQAWHAGPVDNAAVAESLTSVLIFMNKRYKFPGAGIKISGGRAAQVA